MRSDTMGGPSPEFAKAKTVNTGRVQDSTGKVRAILNGTQNSITKVTKAVKGGCKGC